MPPASLLISTICLLSVAGVIIRPVRVPEAVWATLGALMLVVCGLVPPDAALTGIGKGTDVYLFLIGMMLLAEAARQQGLFDWLAVLAVNAARGSARRLFVLLYLVGIVVTAILSNDATAVVLTPAVMAAARKAEVEPLPYVLICAFIANAASFVLPISNPANLVIFGDALPSLLDWLARFWLPSLVSILLTFAALFFAMRHHLERPIAMQIPATPLSRGAAAAASGIAAATVLLTAASLHGWPLGWPTLVAGVGTALAVKLFGGQSLRELARHLSWDVLPLVAGLFVLVTAIESIGLVGYLGRLIAHFAATAPAGTAFAAGGLIGFSSNLVNNLPAGLLAAATLAQGRAEGAFPPGVGDAVLIGVDLGPNLSVTGSLATILWLSALRREKERVGAWQFLRLGAWVMPPALAGALFTSGLLNR